jgi:ArsR family transcriptional regulator
MTIFHADTADRLSPAFVAGSSNETKRRTLPDLRHLPDHTAKRLVGLFKLMADETRLRILFLLQQRRELNVRTLCHLLDQSQPAVSHHLALLRMAGVIEMRRDGKHNFYRLAPKRFEELLAVLSAVSGGDPGTEKQQPPVTSDHPRAGGFR